MTKFDETINTLRDCYKAFADENILTFEEAKKSDMYEDFGTALYYASVAMANSPVYAERVDSYLEKNISSEKGDVVSSIYQKLLAKHELIMSHFVNTTKNFDFKNYMSAIVRNDLNTSLTKDQIDAGNEEIVTETQNNKKKTKKNKKTKAKAKNNKKKKDEKDKKNKKNLIRCSIDAPISEESETTFASYLRSNYMNPEEELISFNEMNADTELALKLLKFTARHKNKGTIIALMMKAIGKKPDDRAPYIYNLLVNEGMDFIDFYHSLIKTFNTKILKINPSYLEPYWNLKEEDFNINLSSPATVKQCLYDWNEELKSDVRKLRRANTRIYPASAVKKYDQEQKKAIVTFVDNATLRKNGNTYFDKYACNY